MDNEKLFSFMEKLYNEIQGMKSEMQQGFKDVKSDISELKDGQQRLEISVENDIKPKIKALFDGYKQNSEQLNMINEKVSKNEEFVLRRIK